MRGEAAAEFELRDYLRVARRRKWTILLTTLAIVGGALALSAAQPKVYQGVADLLLQGRATESLFDPNTGQRSDPARAVQTEIQVLRSRPVRDLVKKELGYLPKRVSASPVGQTDVIQVKAEARDPKTAARIANAYARSYIDFRRTQVVDDLLAAGEQIQAKIIDLQRRIDSPIVGAERDALLQQQSLFRQKLDQLQVDAALKSGGAQLVTPAVAPLSPIRPRPVRNAVVALILGLMAGAALALLREYLDDTLLTKEDVERAAVGTTVLALIPKLPGWKDKRDAVVVSITDPTSPGAEAYRTLRTSVQFLGVDRMLRTLQVTSPSQAEGKSTTMVNLAVALANAGRRVVLVDADLRRPRLHHFLGMEHEPGLTSVLLGSISVDGALRTMPGVEGLQVLTSGPVPPNPSELLASDHFRQTLDVLKARCDIVLLDCPPVLPVTDAAVLAAKVDGTLLVATARVTEGRQLHRATEVLAQVGAPLLGVVFNGVRSDGGYGYGYAYTYAAEPRRAKKAKKTKKDKGKKAKTEGKNDPVERVAVLPPESALAGTPDRDEPAVSTGGSAPSPQR